MESYVFLWDVQAGVGDVKVGRITSRDGMGLLEILLPTSLCPTLGMYL